MKIFFGFVVLLCALLFKTYMYPATMKNEPDGFREIPWHAVVSEGSSASGKNWELVDSPCGELTSCKVYERENEELLLGEAVIDSVLYSFEDRMGFVSVTIYFENIKNFELISKQCVERWGKPSSEKKEGSASGGFDYAESFWRGKKVETTLWYSGRSNFGALHIYLKKSCAVMKDDCDRLLRKEASLSGQSLD